MSAIQLSASGKLAVRRPVARFWPLTTNQSDLPVSSLMRRSPGPTFEALRSSMASVLLGATVATSLECAAAACMRYDPH